MAHLVEFRLLGALEVAIAGRPVILGGPEAAGCPRHPPGVASIPGLQRPLDRRGVGRRSAAYCAGHVAGLRLPIAQTAWRRGRRVAVRRPRLPTRDRRRRDRCLPLRSGRRQCAGAVARPTECGDHRAARAGARHVAICRCIRSFARCPLGRGIQRPASRTPARCRGASG